MRNRALLVLASILGGSAMLYALNIRISKLHDARVISGDFANWVLFYPRSAAPNETRWDSEKDSVSGYLTGSEKVVKILKFGEWRDEKDVPHWAEIGDWDPRTLRGQWIRLPLMYGERARTLSFRRYFPLLEAGASNLRFPMGAGEAPLTGDVSIDLDGWHLKLEPQDLVGPGFRLTYRVKLEGGPVGAHYFIDLISDQGQDSHSAIGPIGEAFLSVSRMNFKANYILRVSRVIPKSLKVTVGRIPGTGFVEFFDPSGQSVGRVDEGDARTPVANARLADDRYAAGRIGNCWFGTAYMENGFPYQDDPTLFPDFQALPDGKSLRATLWKVAEVRRKAIGLTIPKLPESRQKPF